jgi:hypothetical protein
MGPQSQMTNVPGILEVTNLDAENKVQHLGRGYVQAGRSARIGPFEFYGVSGVDTLRLVLQPCKHSGNTPITSTLRLVYGERTVSISPTVNSNLQTCTGLSPSPLRLWESLKYAEEQTIFSVVFRDQITELRDKRHAYVTHIPLRHE